MQKAAALWKGLIQFFQELIYNNYFGHANQIFFSTSSAIFLLGKYSWASFKKYIVINDTRPPRWKIPVKFSGSCHSGVNESRANRLIWARSTPANAWTRPITSVPITRGNFCLSEPRAFAARSPDHFPVARSESRKNQPTLRRPSASKRFLTLRSTRVALAKQTNTHTGARYATCATDTPGKMPTSWYPGWVESELLFSAFVLITLDNDAAIFVYQIFLRITLHLYLRVSCIFFFNCLNLSFYLQFFLNQIILIFSDWEYNVNSKLLPF